MTFFISAIESPRQHCALIHSLDGEKDKKKTWSIFKEKSGYTQKQLEPITDAAKALRHGGIAAISSEQRDDLFQLAWDVVGAYLKKI